MVGLQQHFEISIASKHPRHTRNELTVSIYRGLAASFFACSLPFIVL